jgi:hypothetical protein
MKSSLALKFALGILVLVSLVPSTPAAAANCQIVCCGSTEDDWNGPPPSGSTCCQLFVDLCDSSGFAWDGGFACLSRVCGASSSSAPSVFGAAEVCLPEVAGLR